MTRLASLLAVLSLVALPGCAVLLEGGQAALETPNLERQLNRVNLGISIIRTNNDILHHMPISSDAEWVDQLLVDLNSSQRERITDRLLSSDPYYATVKLTDQIYANASDNNPRAVLTLLLPPISPLGYSLAHRLDVLYRQWPNVHFIPESLQDYSNFPDARLRPVSGAALSVEDAIVALMPVNYQKDIQDAKLEYDRTRARLDAAKQQSALLEDKAKRNANSAAIEQAAAEEQEAQALFDASEEIYFALFDGAVAEIEAGVALGENAQLAYKIAGLLDLIIEGATETASLFSIALLKTPGSLLQVEQELRVFAIALSLGSVGRDKQTQKFLRQRMSLVGNNVRTVFPSIAMGSYFAWSQVRLANKYRKIVDTVIEAYEAQEQQEEALTSLSFLLPKSHASYF